MTFFQQFVDAANAVFQGKSFTSEDAIVIDSADAVQGVLHAAGYDKSNVRCELGGGELMVIGNQSSAPNDEFYIIYAAPFANGQMTMAYKKSAPFDKKPIV